MKTHKRAGKANGLDWKTKMYKNPYKTHIKLAILKPFL